MPRRASHSATPRPRPAGTARRHAAQCPGLSMHALRGVGDAMAAAAAAAATVRALSYVSTCRGSGTNRGSGRQEPAAAAQARRDQSGSGPRGVGRGSRSALLGKPKGGKSAVDGCGCADGAGNVGGVNGGEDSDAIDAGGGEAGHAQPVDPALSCTARRRHARTRAICLFVSLYFSVHEKREREEREGSG